MLTSIRTVLRARNYCVITAVVAENKRSFLREWCSDHGVYVIEHQKFKSKVTLHFADASATELKLTWF